MITDLRKKAKNDFEKYFLKLVNNAIFEKTMANVRKHKYSCHNRKKKELFSMRTKFSYYKIFHKKVISYRNEKNEIIMNKPVYLGLSILELSKILIYEFRYD